MKDKMKSKLVTLLGCLVLLAAVLTLSGCTPAQYINLYNATGDTITIIMEKSHRDVTIPPRTSADFSLLLAPGERVVIQTSKHSWSYSLRSLLFAPGPFKQQHLGVMRAFARIDSRGHIYLLAPPNDHDTPHETTQPAGFPVRPQKT